MHFFLLPIPSSSTMTSLVVQTCYSCDGLGQRPVWMSSVANQFETHEVVGWLAGWLAGCKK